MIQIHDMELRYASGFRLTIERLDVQAGEKLAIVGPSGSGKSTLLKVISGIVRPDRGRIITAGKQLDRLSASELRQLRAQHIGYVFQEFELLEYLTAEENILLPVTLGLCAVPDKRDRLTRLAESVNIGGKLKLRPGQLSHGERQRVALCRALLVTPEIVLADEPTGSLDPHSARVAMQLLIEQTQAMGSTLLVVTHDHTMLEHFDRTFQLPQVA